LFRSRIKLCRDPTKSRVIRTFQKIGNQNLSSSRQTGPGFRGGLKLDLGLHLGDSNWISFGPPS
jgi:hypothetical protein